MDLFKIMAWIYTISDTFFYSKEYKKLRLKKIEVYVAWTISPSF